MPSLLIPIGAAALGAGIGAWIGHSRVLCADGSCTMTGTWYGAAIVGGLLGWVLASSVRGPSATAANGDQAERPDTAERH